MALFLLETGRGSEFGDAGFTPLHWAAAPGKTGLQIPYMGSKSRLAGIPDRAAKLQLVKALLAHGANPNARMTRAKPAFAGGYTDPVGATPFLLASSVDDVEMMRLLLAAGADPKLMTATNATAVMAAADLNHSNRRKRSHRTQAIEAVKFLLNLGLRRNGVTTSTKTPFSVLHIADGTRCLNC